MIHRKYSLFGARVLSVLVIGLTSVVLVKGTMTLSLPNAVTYPYNLPPAATFNVAVPALDRPVLLMGVCNTVNFRGVGQVTILRASLPPEMLVWSGYESITPTGLTGGFGSALGQHILYLDFSHQVQVEVLNAFGFRVRNGAAAARSGVITMIW